MMIALLDGLVAEKTEDYIIVSCSGVGYGVWVALEDYGRAHIGSSLKLYIYEHIREQSHDLYGFIDKSTKHLFELLLSVNGVGPKMAINVLSIAKADLVKQAIAKGDVNMLKTANGVGKRVAERIVVDLKGKVGFDANSDGIDAFLSYNASADEAFDALLSLGFSSQDAQNALKDIDINLPIEQRIKLALQKGNRR
jgi:Holliday junction DNA helicase RuvA